ncbi:AAA family ATPase [Candidatus Kaiserbacteria bacterium]|nr:AAA family ATPase [Candidatus Kaiserbacteria bacterium]
MNGNSIAQIAAMAKEYKAWMDQFDDMFVGRGNLLKLMRYALLMRQHILVFGPPGTSKTQLCDQVFAGIIGAPKFATELTAFMTEDGIFGPYNVKLLREQGILERNVSGMLPQAEFARLGELLDANPQTLRSTLGILNERRMMRGTQQINAPLFTVYCDTNKDPADYIRRNPDAFAVLDRLLFIAQVGYLKDQKEISEMVKRHQQGRTKILSRTISANIIEKLSSFIVLPPGLITDPTIIDTFGRAVEEYREARRKMSDEEKKAFILPDISDRRICLASQLLEVEAILNGRVEAKVEDVLAAVIVICMSEAEHKLWEPIAGEHIEEHKRNAAAQTTTSQGLAIKGLCTQLEQQVISALAGTPLSEIGHTFQVLAEQLSLISPKDPQVQKLYDEAKTKFAGALGLLQKRTLNENGIAKLPF